MLYILVSTLQINISCLHQNYQIMRSLNNNIQISEQMRNQLKQPIGITFSGFTANSELQQYITMVQRLGACCHDALNQNTQVLIIKKVISQKYKIATFRNIKVVTLAWLLDSYDNGRFLQTKKYVLPGLFYGITVGLYAFEPEQQLKLKNIFTNNKAESIILSKATLNQKLLEVDIVIVSPKEISRIQEMVDKIEVPVVGIEWVQKCIQRNHCVFPADYALNHQYQRYAASMDVLLKNISIKLDDLFKNVKLNDPRYQFLSDTCIYIHDYGEKPTQLIKQVISLCGGFFINQFGSMATHVLVNNYTEQQYSKFTKYGNLIEIVKLKWLTDSFIALQRLPEQDYRVRKQRSKLETKIDRSQFMGFNENNNNNTFSFTFGNNNFNSNGISDLRKSISFSSIQKKEQSKQKIRTTLFKGYNFFILPEQKKRQQIKGMTAKINLNGGNLYESISNKLKLIHFIMVDSSANQEILSSYNKYRSIIRLVSYRWINLCIAKNYFIKQDEPNYFTFRPFFFSTPVKQFLLMKFEIIGYDDVLKKRIRQLIEVIGNSKVINIKANITHAICQPSRYKQQKKYLELKQANPNIKFVKLQWIEDCLKQKKPTLPVDNYLLD